MRMYELYDEQPQCTSFENLQTPGILVRPLGDILNAQPNSFGSVPSCDPRMTDRLASAMI